MGLIPGFSDQIVTANGRQIACSIGGDGPPVLLLHGFPQTRAMWMEVAPALAEHFSVVAADLRGYGDSSKPTGAAQMTFRNMAADQVALMQTLGHNQFHMIGHDRGARTGHRMALDHPDALRSLTVMDIVPTHLLLDPLRRDVALSYYHWFFLAQPSPAPETMIGHDPDTYFESCLFGWGHASAADFPATAMAAYRDSWRRPETISGMCDDYRAGATLDFDMDAQDLHRRVSCPALVLYGADGAMARHFDVPATWADRLTNLQSGAIPGGHFFIDQSPEETVEALLAFLTTCDE